jgi:hypothetical protein
MAHLEDLMFASTSPGSRTTLSRGARRGTGALVAALVATLAVTTPAMAQSNAERAAQLNDEGKALMQGQQFAQASERFRQAITLSAEGRFYFNLCVALYQQGEFGNALTACKAVEANGADAALKGKTDKMIGKVKEEIRKLGIDPDAPPPPDGTGGTGTGNPDGTGGTGTGNPDGTGGTGTGNPDGTGGTGTGGTGTGNAVGAPPATGQPPATLFQGAAPDHSYTWTIGGELVAIGGRFGNEGAYGGSGVGIRLHSDYLALPAAKAGFQGYLGINQVGSEEVGTQGAGLTVIDAGVAAYKHFCRGRLCVTPLAGVHLGVLQNSLAAGDSGLLALGLRAGGELSYSVGPRFEHTVAARADLQLYTAGSSDSVSAAGYDLDRGSSAMMIGAGYTYRFNTPFGQSPFVTLE